MPFKCSLGSLDIRLSLCNFVLGPIQLIRDLLELDIVLLDVLEHGCGGVGLRWCRGLMIGVVRGVGFGIDDEGLPSLCCWI